MLNFGRVFFWSCNFLEGPLNSGKMAWAHVTCLQCRWEWRSHGMSTSCKWLNILIKNICSVVNSWRIDVKKNGKEYTVNILYHNISDFPQNRGIPYKMDPWPQGVVSLMLLRHDTLWLINLQATHPRTIGSFGATPTRKSIQHMSIFLVYRHYNLLESSCVKPEVDPQIKTIYPPGN